MRGKGPSPADKTQVRITKDKQALKRLTKEAQKRLIEGHSPVAYDYVNYELQKALYNEDKAQNAIDTSLNSEWNVVDDYFTDAEKAQMETLEVWSTEYKEILKTAENRSFGYLYDGGTKVDEDMAQAARDALKRLQQMADEGNDFLRQLTADENYWYALRADQFNQFLDDAKTQGGDENIGWMEAIGAVPGIIIGIGSLLDGFVNLDPEKFIEDNVELAKAQKRLQVRLKEEEF